MSTETRDSSLRRRLDLALLAAGVVLLLTVLAAGAALLTVREHQREVLVVYYEAITQTDTTYQALLDVETSVRGYLLTADPVTLEPLERILSRPDPAVDVEPLLEASFGADSEVVRAREQAGEAAQTWYFDWAQPAIEEVRTGGAGSVTTEDIERGRQLFDEVRAPTEQHLALLKEGRLAAVGELRAATNTLVAAVALLSVLLLAGGALLYVYLRRWVTRPLESLAGDVREVSTGDLDHPVDPVGLGEVREVSEVVEEMRVGLVASLAEVRQARAEIEDSHRRLQDQAEDLARSNRDLEQFAYVASHDLQEPLRKIASFTQLLQKRDEGQLDDRADQYIAFAVDGAKRMQRLINDLLGFSRVGRIGGELSDVDMQAVLGRVTGDLGQLVEESGATVEGVDLPVVRGEEPLLAQLLANLVGNALKFCSPDRAPHVRVTAERRGDVWEFACADNGIGIDAQYAERVFVIFQRLHPKDVYEGTGIGLALCKKIVEYHGGHIWIDAEVEQGTIIRWSLPIEAAGRAAQLSGANPLSEGAVTAEGTHEGAATAVPARTAGSGREGGE